jgi:VWFA-related protein
VRLLAGLLVAWSFGAVGASDPVPPESPLPTGLEEKVMVRLVQVRITATDRRGRPIEDLRADEIEVKARGVRRRVAYLEPLRRSATARDDLPDVELFVALPGGSPLAATSGEGGGDHVAFLVDVENDYALLRAEAIESVIGFARDLPQGTLAAVFSYDGELHVEVPFTADREAVIVALGEAWSRHGRPQLDARARVGRLVDQFEDCVVSGGEMSRKVADEQCVRTVIHEYTQQEQPRTLDYARALGQMIRILGGVDGRKTVFAFSHGVAVDPTPVVIEALRAVLGSSEVLSAMQLYSGFGEQPRLELDRALKLAIQSGVTLHIVDRVPVPSGDYGARRGAMLEPGARPLQAAHTAAQADSQEIAAATGGLFVAAPDLPWGLGQVVNAEKGAYELGFYVDEVLSPERLAKLDIETSRKGTRIAHRRGEYAAPPQRGLRGRIALGAPKAGAKPERVLYDFRIEVDPKTIGYRVTGDEAQANFTLHVTVLDPRGTRLAESHHFINHSYPRELWEAEQAAPMTVTGWLEVPPGAYEIRAYLHNTESGLGGPLLTGLEVPQGSAAEEP